jgi:GAF domain-containing protein
MNKKQKYQLASEQVKSFILPSLPWVSVLGNITAVLKEKFPLFSWVGFYLFDGSKLILGPFQGLIGCESIELTRGVCGHAATTGKTVVVPDVAKFPGHIACDQKSKSEIVVPLFSSKKTLLGVLDVDSYQLNSFDSNDQIGLEQIGLLVSQFIENKKNIDLT